jgi:hypothetical protein
MFATIRRARAWRVAFLVATAAAVSALATNALVSGPGAASAASSAATSQTRSVSCNAYQFVPADSNTGYDYIKTLRTRIGGAGSGFFVCNPTLPTRAVVKKVEFSILDNAVVGEVVFCGMYRAGLSNATAAQSVQELAAFPSTGRAQAPGFVRLTDTSIKNATIDNSNFSYWLQCNLSLAADGLGIYGADVIYTISNTNG